MALWKSVARRVFPTQLKISLTYLIHHRKYVSLSPLTRIYIGVGMMAWAGLGITFTDGIGRAFGFNPTDEDREELTRTLPTIQTVDRRVTNEKS